MSGYIDKDGRLGSTAAPDLGRFFLEPIDITQLPSYAKLVDAVEEAKMQGNRWRFRIGRRLAR